ncbi:hypothetical protein [Burkholderia anthina]|uniref:hypothetical protein n=1 Tax=Burkholderia anthina TaxID=179879 RepID=UPI00158959F6|nr:hypothetical protein [Burkholderia anthina]
MTKLASPIAAQSGVLIESIGPNAFVLDKTLDVSREQLIDGVEFTLTLADGNTETVRVSTVSTSAHRQAPGVVAIVTAAPGFLFAPHPGTPWSVASSE